MTRLHGKVALITGAAAGIGAAIARRFVAEAAQVIVTDIQAQPGAALAAELGCRFISQDVTDEGRWNEVMREVEQHHGALHVLVNNAGIEGSFEMADPERTRLADWQQVQRVNADGVFLGCRAGIPALRRSGGGAIINLSSTAALGATPDFVSYGASKAAVLHLTRSVALYCATRRNGVRCNSVHPGVVLTPMMRRIAAARASERGIASAQALEELRSAIPDGTFQAPEDIASAVLFLASDDARCITGASLVVDGGATLRFWQGPG